MLIVMAPTASDDDLEAVMLRVREAGMDAERINGRSVTVIGAVGAPPAAELALEACSGVQRVIEVTPSFALASLEASGGTRTVVDIGSRSSVGAGFTVIAGPCAVESHEVLLETAALAAAAGVDMLRGGAFKPRTSPYAFQGLGEAALELLAEAKARTGLPIVTEVTDVRMLGAVLEVADMVQVGARNMHNFALLSELGELDVPVLLKRGMAATIEELLLAAEYVLKGGNERVVLCERGIRTFESRYRFTLDVTAVPVLRELSHLPVIVDPSHAAGRRELVEPLSLAAAAVGADGLIVEVHSRPQSAECDAAQALPAQDLEAYVEAVRRVARAAAAQTLAGTT